jgi:mannose-6-phosphate isomerase-like protein (cupin superfamily)
MLAMSGSVPHAVARALLAAVPFDVERVQKRLEGGGGGYEIVHTSPGLEIGVYVLVAPEPDLQQPHADDEVYIVLDGRGVLEVEGKPVGLERGQAVFVPAGARHAFSGYEGLSVLVIFARRWRLEPQAGKASGPV